MGFEEVYAVDGGTGAWTTAGLTLETGMPRNVVAGLAEAQKNATMVSPQDLDANPSEHILFVDTSQDFARAHVPGARWISRSWLEIEVPDAVPSKTASITVTCRDGRNSALAAATLQEMGYSDVRVLEGGVAAWRQAGLAVEQGLTGIVRPPADINYLGVDRSYAEMMNYLRWETELGAKYASS
jgi:rhodanese-related sulfurtransferase